MTAKKDNIKQIHVGGIPITPFLTMSSALDSIISPSGKIKPGFAVAINAEKVMAYQKNATLKKSIDSATICYADGIPVVWTVRKKGCDNIRIPGCELWEELMKKAGEIGLPVYLVGGEPGVIDKTQEKLKTEFGVNIVGYSHGFFKDANKIIAKIMKSKAEIVTVGMGSPKQEIFIKQCRDKIPNAFYMGVGGTFNVFVGKAKRAPKWMQDVHLEWLYRLLKEPTRIKRQAVYVRYMYYHLLGHL